MQLRPFRSSDLQTLYEIDQACFPPGVSYSRDELARFIHRRNSTTWVAEADDAIVGFLVAARQPQRMGHIITIEVVKSWRRRGVGAALLDAAEDWARRQGLRGVYLETAEDNLDAQQFYQAQGFEKIEKLDRYYSNHGAAWLMVKWLK